MRAILRLIIYMRPYAPLAIGATVSLLLVTVANLISPLLLRWIVDDGIRASSVSSQGVAFDIRNELFAKIQTLSFSYHDRAQTGQLMTRATNDVELLRQFTGQGLFQLLNSAFMLIGSVALLFWLNWQLTLATITIIPVIGSIMFYFAKNIRPMFSKIQKRLGFLNTILQENLAGIRVVKAFARSKYEEERFDVENQKYKQLNLDFVRTASITFPSIFLFSNLGVMIILGYGGNLAMNNTLSIGDLVAFISFLGYVVQPLMTIGFVTGVVVRAAVSAERIFEVIDTPNEVTDKADATPLPTLEGQVAFDQVRFRYVGQEEDVLKGISFTAEPGQTVAILGSTGSGKSTIINLLPRFYDVTEGAVLLDGHDVRDATLDSLRSQIGIVLQETTLFSGTIRDNIAYGRPDATDEEVLTASKAAQAHPFILEQPDGYDTTVGERGVGLSGGQKQRVAIARALLLDPRILILDDSTSAVDAETEYQIQQALDQLMVGRTSFVIAQRISTVRNADLILVLDKGLIAATGTHEELMMDNPLYMEIVQSQLKEDKPASSIKETDVEATEGEMI